MGRAAWIRGPPVRVSGGCCAVRPSRGPLERQCPIGGEEEQEDPADVWQGAPASRQERPGAAGGSRACWPRELGCWPAPGWTDCLRPQRPDIGAQWPGGVRQEEGSGAAVSWAARAAAQRCIGGAGKRAQPCLKTW
ncbi:hypothetical protein NDU88_004280 [Pleurodeles waltl]|uniref:Uncharacterized protein n=1 Tax=Pleurodeles waltl TaxID=8319 RepID=A0AAV7V318_PLEWA|nr:hypothetical protein NDU88_004280 [Pleurodeles waltl]